MFGLFGQQVACATGILATAAPAAVAGMSADCMELMHDQQPQPAQKPGKDISLGCFASMGCLAPLAQREVSESDLKPRPASPPVFWQTATILLGTDVPPEQHPPTLLR